MSKYVLQSWKQKECFIINEKEETEATLPTHTRSPPCLGPVAPHTRLSFSHLLHLFPIWFQNKGAVVAPQHWVQNRECLSRMCPYLGTRALSIWPQTGPSQAPALPSRLTSHVAVSTLLFCRVMVPTLPIWHTQLNCAQLDATTGIQVRRAEWDGWSGCRGLQLTLLVKRVCSQGFTLYALAQISSVNTALFGNLIASLG